MSTDLEIPKEDRDEIRKWLVEGQAPAEAVLSALKDAKPTLRRGTLADRIARAINGDRAVVNAVLRIFINVLYTIRSKDDIKERIETVYRSVEGSGASDADKLKAFSERIMQLTSLPALAITAKALRIKLSNRNTFCRARTTSELRPVFEEQSFKPEAAIIVHQLNIVFHRAPEMDEEEFSVTLDAEDLESLRKVIDRALTKDKKIADTFGQGIQLLVESSS